MLGAKEKQMLYIMDMSSGHREYGDDATELTRGEGTAPRHQPRLEERLELQLRPAPRQDPREQTRFLAALYTTDA